MDWKEKKVINLIRQLENNLIDYRIKLRRNKKETTYMKALLTYRAELEMQLNKLVTNGSKYRALKTAEAINKVKSFKELGYTSRKEVLKSSRYDASYRLIKKFPRLKISLELALCVVVRLNQYYQRPLERKLRRKNVDKS